MDKSLLKNVPLNSLNRPTFAENSQVLPSSLKIRFDRLYPSKDLISSKEVFVPVEGTIGYYIKRLFREVQSHVKNIAAQDIRTLGDTKVVKRTDNNTTLDVQGGGKYNVQKLLTYKILRVN